MFYILFEYPDLLNNLFILITEPGSSAPLLGAAQAVPPPDLPETELWNGQRGKEPPDTPAIPA